MAGKVLAKIMLIRILEHVVDLVLPESQCGFRSGRSTTYMIFAAQQLQENCRKQHQDSYMTIVDLTKAFDTVKRNLVSNLSFSGDLTNEIQRRINHDSSAFGRLSKRVFGNLNLTIYTNIAVYNAVDISTILYGCETWVPYRRHIRLLESFHIRRLQLILGLCWWQKVTRSKIKSRAEIPSMESMLLQHQLRWLGHVIRMPPSRLPH